MAKKYQYYVNHALLVKADACSYQRAKFIRVFGQDTKVLVTVENIEKALRANLHVVWLLVKVRNAKNRKSRKIWHTKEIDDIYTKYQNLAIWDMSTLTRAKYYYELFMAYVK